MNVHLSQVDTTRRINSSSTYIQAVYGRTWRKCSRVFPAIVAASLNFNKKPTRSLTDKEAPITTPSKPPLFDFKKESDFILLELNNLTNEQKLKAIRLYFKKCPFDNSKDCQEFLQNLINASIQIPCTGFLYSLSSFICYLPISEENKQKLLIMGLENSIKHSNFDFFQPWFFTSYRLPQHYFITMSLMDSLSSLCKEYGSAEIEKFLAKYRCLIETT